MQCRGPRTGARSNQYLPGWQGLRRSVKRGKHALTLCMSITRKVRDEGSHDSESEDVEHTIKKRYLQAPQVCSPHRLAARNSFRHACPTSAQDALSRSRSCDIGSYHRIRLCRHGTKTEEPSRSRMKQSRCLLRGIAVRGGTDDERFC